VTQVDLEPADVSLLMALLEAHKAQLQAEVQRVEALIMRLPFSGPRPPPHNEPERLEQPKE
jgi:hypothetical protein